MFLGVIELLSPLFVSIFNQQLLIQQIVFIIQLEKQNISSKFEVW